MYNPLALITPELMKALLKEPKLFVRQYYPRGEKPGVVPLLLTYYYKENDVDVHRANFHFKQLASDKYRFLYDSENEEHKQKLLLAAAQPEGYRIFINLLPQKWQAPNSLRRKIYAYVLKKFEGPLYNKSQKLNIQLQDLYGKLYLVLSWKGNKAEVLLDEVENSDPYVL